MNSTYVNASDMRVIAPGHLQELVRGQEAALLERLAPVVRTESVMLDLTEVERIDAAGIAALIALYGAARDAGHQFHVCNANHHVAEILTLVGLDRILLSCRTAADQLAQAQRAEICFEAPAA